MQKKKLVIVGGGMAGWLAAAALAKQLKPKHYEITIIESSHIDNTSVGESVLPSVISFLLNLGLDESDLIHKAQASLKLGIRFQDWSRKGESYFHPLGGASGRKMAGIDFFQCWLKSRSEGYPTPLMDYFPSAVMAKNSRFDFPFKVSAGSPLAAAGYALHLDASHVVGYLRDFLQNQNVKRINAHVVGVNQRENGNIDSLELNSRQRVQGDFFIDCSGLRGLLIGESLNASYESWNQYLPCDRAVVVHSTRSGLAAPFTTSRAREAGWSWQIPLQKWMSSGYVFSSGHCSDAQAMRVLLGSVEGEPLNEPHFIPFRTGMREQMWKKNCVALGLAGGFLEPLESTAIHLITRGIQCFLDLFPNLSPDEQDWPGLASEYNARVRTDFEEIRDFLVLHYCMTQRTDEEFWRRCRAAPVPASLAEKIELFKAQGQLRIDHNSLFKESSWQAVLTGMGVDPRHHHPFADMGSFARVHKSMQADRIRIEEAVQALPLYNGTLG